MKKLVRNVLRPLLARAGTALATLLVAKYGFDGALVHQLVTLLAALVLVGVDLVFSRWNRDDAVLHFIASAHEKRPVGGYFDRGND